MNEWPIPTPSLVIVKLLLEAKIGISIFLSWGTSVYLEIDAEVLNMYVWEMEREKKYQSFFKETNQAKTKI